MKIRPFTRLFLTVAGQLTLIMNGRLISNQLFFDCSGFGGSSHLFDGPELPLKPGTGAGFFLPFGNQPQTLNGMSPFAAASSQHRTVTAAIAGSALIW
jgi:hypothetical protein